MADGRFKSECYRVNTWTVIANRIIGRAICQPFTQCVSPGRTGCHEFGRQYRCLRLFLYFTASVFTATAVTVAGSVGFVGLVIPHMLRLLGARDHRILLPCSILLGGSFLVIADSIARTVIAPQQLPVGVITAIIGVPSFIIILRSTITK